jgi:hypothetical protein
MGFNMGIEVIADMMKELKLCHRQFWEMEICIVSKVVRYNSCRGEKFLGLSVLIGQVRKNNIKDHWSAYWAITTPIFSVMKLQHQLITISAVRFLKSTFNNYLVEKFRTNNSPQKT